MYKSKKILAFVPARAGSKRIKGKNNKLLNGIPLFEYSINIAKESKYIDEIIVSTDSYATLERAHEMGCIKNSLRPDYLSGDKARIIDAILYEIEENRLNNYSALVLLQPTFPIRTVDMLDKAIEKYFENETSLITVVESKEQPVMMRKIENGKLNKIISFSSDIRSQDFPKIYKIIGSIYINNLNKISSTTVLNENETPFIIDSKYDVDIDTIEDFNRAEMVIKK